MASPGSVVIQFLVDAKKAATDAAAFATSLGKVDDETANLDRALDGLDTELASIGRAADAVETDMKGAGVGFDTAADDSEDAARRLRAAAQDMGAGVRQGADDIDTETGHIRTNMQETGKEAGAEFIGNMAEGIGSGTANVTDVVQGTLGGLTNLAATLGGPVGLAAAGAAAGIGIVFGKVKAEADKAAEELKDLITDLWEVGTTSGKVAEKLIWDKWMTQLRDSPDLMADITDGMRTAGITGEEMQDAITGDPAAQQAVVDKIKRMSDLIAQSVRNGKPLTPQQQTYIENSSKINEELAKQGIKLDDAGDLLADNNYLMGKTADNASETKDELGGAKNKAKELNDELDDAARDRDVSLTISLRAGQTVSEWINDQWRRSGSGSGQAAGTAQTRAAAPVQVVLPRMPRVTDEQVYRAVHRVMLAGDARNGRRVILG